MSEQATSEAVETHEGHEKSHEHPSDWAYIKIALILATFTGIEVLTYFESAIPIFENNSVTIATLMVLMVVKFFLVATWFMHLRFDNPIFGRMFVAGLILATGVYAIALSAFEFWA
ncbi:MAG: cytochrome C oxidase subunit IV family protein [Acidimicrobiales bacterium]